MKVAGRQVVTLFDEDETTVTDNTEHAFGFVAGDEKKTVTITAKRLVIQEYQDGGVDKPKCFGITASAEPQASYVELFPKKNSRENDQDFVHNTIEDVFPIEQVHVWDPLGFIESVDNSEKILDITEQQLDAEYTEQGNGIKLEIGYLYRGLCTKGMFYTKPLFCPISLFS